MCSRIIYKNSKFSFNESEMADPWNEPTPRVDNGFKQQIISRTSEYLTVVKWRNNGVPKTLDEAVNLAKLGQDGGETAAMALRPTGNDFHEWIQWANMTTYLYNRETSFVTLLSCLRNVIMLVKSRHLSKQ